MSELRAKHLGAGVRQAPKVLCPSRHTLGPCNYSRPTPTKRYHESSNGASTLVGRATVEDTPNNLANGHSRPECDVSQEMEVILKQRDELLERVKDALLEVAHDMRQRGPTIVLRRVPEGAIAGHLPLLHALRYSDSLIADLVVKKAAAWALHEITPPNFSIPLETLVAYFSSRTELDIVLEDTFNSEWAGMLPLALHVHTHGTLCGGPLPASTTTHHALAYLRGALDHFDLPDLLDLPLHLPLAAAATNVSRDPLHIQQAALLLQLYTQAAVEQAAADVLELLPPSAALMSDSGVALLVAPPPLQRAASAAAAAAAAAASSSPPGTGGVRSTGGRRGGGGTSGSGGSAAEGYCGHGAHSNRLNVGLLGYPDGWAGQDAYDSKGSLLAVRCDGRHVARSVSVSELLPYGSRGQLAQGARAVLQEQLARCVPGLHATWRPAVVRYPPPLGTQEVEVLLVGMGGPARS